MKNPVRLVSAILIIALSCGSSFSKESITEGIINNYKAELYYWKDQRTDICFATYLGDSKQWTTCVPCDHVPESLLVKAN